MQAARLGVYVHFPYCLSKCPYCDFASTAARHIDDERYTRAVLRELEARVAPLRGREVHSIFIGGGTPSLWAPASVGRVLDALASSLQVTAGCEVTLEANPGAADAERFAGYRAAGVNRLSMGVQSFQPATLTALGRGHDGPTAVLAYEAARRAGFDNVSMDFIYGVHGQTEAEVEADARRAASLGSEHLSAYALTLDKASLAQEVPLAKQLQRGEVRLPDDEVVVRMQRIVRDVFRGQGFERYEISNYAKPGPPQHPLLDRRRVPRGGLRGHRLRAHHPVLESPQRREVPRRGGAGRAAGGRAGAAHGRRALRRAPLHGPAADQRRGPRRGVRRLGTGPRGARGDGASPGVRWYGAPDVWAAGAHG